VLAQFVIILHVTFTFMAKSYGGSANHAPPCRNSTAAAFTHSVVCKRDCTVTSGVLKQR